MPDASAVSGAVSCGARGRRQAKTFSEAGCSTDDIDFDVLDSHGDGAVLEEETHAILEGEARVNYEYGDEAED